MVFLIVLIFPMVQIVKCFSQEYPGTVTRPVLSDEEAARLSTENYLSPWTPQGSLVPAITKYMVGKGRSFMTIQAAVNAAILETSNTERQFISIDPGLYEETVFIPASSVPLTLYGSLDSKIVLNQSAKMTVRSWIKQVNPNGIRYKPDDPSYSIYNSCAKKDTDVEIGTRCTAVVWTKGLNTEIFNISIENSAIDAQAVALRNDGENLHLDQVHLLGHQDTFYAANGKAFVNNSYLEGDIDYVCGEGTVVFNNTIFKTLGDRKNNGIIFAPKTAPDNKYGFLVENSKLTCEDVFRQTTKVLLGRPWDPTEYIPGESPNGQLLIRHSLIEEMINVTAPWGQGIGSNRDFRGNIDANRDLNDNSFNRFWEYKNND